MANRKADPSRYFRVLGHRPEIPGVSDRSECERKTGLIPLTIPGDRADCVDVPAPGTHAYTCPKCGTEKAPGVATLSRLAWLEREQTRLDRHGVKSEIFSDEGGKLYLARSPW